MHHFNLKMTMKINTLTDFRLKCFKIMAKVDSFEKYDIVAMQSDNAKFYASKMIKVTSGCSRKQFFPPGGATIQKEKTAEIFF